MQWIEMKRSQAASAVAAMDEACGLTAAQIMTAEPTCIRPETTASDLVRLFQAMQFRHLLVTDAQGRLAGVVSDRDVLRFLGPERQAGRSALAGVSAADMMSRDLITIGPETRLERAIVLMVENGVSCLPVVDGEVVKGIVTNTDLHLVLQVMLETIRQAGEDARAVPASGAPQT